jgi:hypothetical protein
MLNLNTTFSISDPSQPGLPVLVDLNWHGKVMTSPSAGIIPSRSPLCAMHNDESEVCL